MQSDVVEQDPPQIAPVSTIDLAQILQEEIDRFLVKKSPAVPFTVSIDHSHDGTLVFFIVVVIRDGLE